MFAGWGVSSNQLLLILKSLRNQLLEEKKRAGGLISFGIQVFLVSTKTWIPGFLERLKTAVPTSCQDERESFCCCKEGRIASRSEKKIPGGQIPIKGKYPSLLMLQAIRNRVFLSHSILFSVTLYCSDRSSLRYDYWSGISPLLSKHSLRI